MAGGFQVGLCDSDSRPRSAIGRMVRVLGAPPSCVIGAQLRSWAAFGCDRAGEIYKMRTFRVAVLGLALGGCAIQRAEIAQDARVQMVGMSKEQVLGCMGATATKAAEGKPEVWGFNSGNGMTVVDASYGRYGCSAVASSHFCNINIVFTGGQVATVNYAGPTGGLLTAGEQCAHAVTPKRGVRPCRATLHAALPLCD